MQDYQHLVVRLAAAGDGTECECVLSGQTGECWLAASEECLRLIVTCWLSPHIVSHTSFSSSSSTPPSSSAASSSPTPFCRSQCTVTQPGRRKKAVSLFSTQRSTSVQQFWHWFIPKLLMHVNQTKILFSPVNENHCAKQASNFQHLNNCLTEFCLIAARMC